jgi:hypothetical protein
MLSKLSHQALWEVASRDVNQLNLTWVALMAEVAEIENEMTALGAALQGSTQFLQVQARFNLTKAQLTTLADEKLKLETKLQTVKPVRLRANSRPSEVAPLGGPPSGCMFLLACVARPGRADELLGDAESEYNRMVIRMGHDRARWWYRIYVLKVAIRMLPSAAARLVLLHKLLQSF